MKDLGKEGACRRLLYYLRNESFDHDKGVEKGREKSYSVRRVSGP